MPKYSSISSSPDYVETDPLFNFIEQQWMQPCSAALPLWLQGFCLYGPAFICMAALLGTVALLAWYEKRPKAGAPPTPPLPKQKETKKTN